MNLFGTKAIIDWKCEFRRGDNEHITNQSWHMKDIAKWSFKKSHGTLKRFF
jgi:hypothetical protein